MLSGLWVVESESLNENRKYVNMILGVLIGILVILLSAALYWRRSNGDKKTKEGQVHRRPVPRGIARMRRRPQTTPEVNDEENEGEDVLEEAGIKKPEGKIGKKKMEKLQMKADKKLAREAEEREREERKKKAEKEEEEREKEREREVRKEEEERLQREEKERREQEEYLKLKEAFKVDEEGFDEDQDPQDEGDLLTKFIDHIKESKIVLLEDLASHFKMKAQDTIDRVNQLQQEGRLTGVIDDRGKFIYVSPEELQEVARFIRQRGRVSIAELAENSNQLINMNTACAVPN